MRHLNKFASALAVASLGLIGLTGCESGELYTIDSPDWLASRIDSIAQAQGEPEVALYTVGATDFSSGWWVAFSHYYQIPEKAVWEAEFDLNINPDATNTYKNFALIISNDVDRGGSGYKEYGAIRYDHQPSGNSEWGDYINRDLVTSNLTFQTDTDAGVDKLGGRVKLTVDRSKGGLVVTMFNGTVKKVYNQEDALVNLNKDESNTKIRCFIVPEGSYINFMKTNIVSIEDAADAEPVSLEIKGVPDQILLDQDLEEQLGGMTGTVTFASGASAAVKYADMNVYIVPDATTYGVKTLVAAYAKTSKGNNSENVVIATAEVEIVDKLSEAVTTVVFPEPTYLGYEDNTTPWWSCFTENIKIERRQTVVASFTNYTNTVSNWNNFLVILNKADYTEYAVLRADNYGWGDGYGTCTPSGCTCANDDDWTTWRQAMNGAKVTVSITNNANGTVDVRCQIKGSNGVDYEQNYIGIGVSDKDDVYFRFTCEGSHLVFCSEEDYTDYVHPQPTTIGAEDNSTGWWGDHSQNIKIESAHTAVANFTNYTCGVSNWNNFVVVLCKADNTEYAVVRADNFGWGAGYDGNDKLVLSGGQSNWGAWLAAMNGAKCRVAVRNCGDGTANVDIQMLGTDDVTYIQYYHGICGIDVNDLYFRFTVDGCHLVFD